MHCAQQQNESSVTDLFREEVGNKTAADGGPKDS